MSAVSYLNPRLSREVRFVLFPILLQTFSKYWAILLAAIIFVQVKGIKLHREDNAISPPSLLHLVLEEKKDKQNMKDRGAKDHEQREPDRAWEKIQMGEWRKGSWGGADGKGGERGKETGVEELVQALRGC